MKLEELDIKNILLKGNYITAEDAKQAQVYAETHHATLLEYLLDRGILTKTLLGQALAESFNLPFADLGTNPPPKELVLKIPADFAQNYRVVVFKETPEEVTVATDNPATSELPQLLSPLFAGQKVSLAFALSEDIDQAFIHYRQSLQARFVSIITNQKKVAPEILDQIFSDALVYRASDVHFEPREEDVLTRFRVDGVLHEVGNIPKVFYESILNRIKVQAKLRIDDHFSAQDGALRFAKGETALDARVSIIPTLNGEKVVMRLLSEYVRSLNLADLGLSESDYALLVKAAKRPFGMVLVTGPTGSGKTTTLYALLKSLNNPDINITTIEDPVEYKLPAFNQIQVNPATNLTFGKGLRSILRQDPDIILVGEIRDKDTAEVAVNAALTGHLLFSTFHANDASTAVPRLLDIGLERFLVASTLELIVAQRLLRRICPTCRHSIDVPVQALAQQFPEAARYLSGSTVTLYQGKGCSACNMTGYKGRVGIFEIIAATKELRELIAQTPTSAQVWQLARRQGAHSLFEDGLAKVKNGVTTMEELMRVAPPGM